MKKEHLHSPDGATITFEITLFVGRIKLNATTAPVDIPSHKDGSIFVEPFFEQQAMNSKDVTNSPGVLSRLVLDSEGERLLCSGLKLYVIIVLHPVRQI